MNDDEEMVIRMTREHHVKAQHHVKKMYMYDVTALFYIVSVILLH